ncbi:MAG: hypothetical protein EKK53_11695 [Burkholderiales bacterium]|nr:MAG: hypothetical protein EKK53_11695 [Burkholderiales bacterium]
MINANASTERAGSVTGLCRVLYRAGRNANIRSTSVNESPPSLRGMAIRVCHVSLKHDFARLTLDVAASGMARPAGAGGKT